MDFGIFLILAILIICGTISLNTYMDFCYKSQTKMFANPRYEERIKNLEKEIKELKEK